MQYNVADNDLCSNALFGTDREVTEVLHTS